MKTLYAMAVGISSICALASMVLVVKGQCEFETLLVWLFAVTASSFLYHKS